MPPVFHEQEGHGYTPLLLNKFQQRLSLNFCPQILEKHAVSRWLINHKEKIKTEYGFDRNTDKTEHEISVLDWLPTLHIFFSSEYCQISTVFS